MGSRQSSLSRAGELLSFSREAHPPVVVYGDFTGVLMAKGGGKKNPFKASPMGKKPVGGGKKMSICR